MDLNQTRASINERQNTKISRSTEEKLGQLLRLIELQIQPETKGELSSAITEFIYERWKVGDAGRIYRNNWIKKFRRMNTLELQIYLKQKDRSHAKQCFPQQQSSIPKRAQNLKNKAKESTINMHNQSKKKKSRYQRSKTNLKNF